MNTKKMGYVSRKAREHLSKTNFEKEENGGGEGPRQRRTRRVRSLPAMLCVLPTYLQVEA